jgi:hypothetical protein
MEALCMQFNGKLLQRGFWLYVWDIKGADRNLYVGRTGDSSSPHASSPFRRIGQHLDTSLNAKGNALGKQLKKSGIDPHHCTFEMVAFGPLFPEQISFEAHRPVRNKVAALEGTLARELRKRGYSVLGTHPPESSYDPRMWSEISENLETYFPRLSEGNG